MWAISLLVWLLESNIFVRTLRRLNSITCLGTDRILYNNLAILFNVFSMFCCHFKPHYYAYGLDLCYWAIALEVNDQLVSKGSSRNIGRRWHFKEPLIFSCLYFSFHVFWPITRIACVTGKKWWVTVKFIIFHVPRSKVNFLILQK